MKIDFNDGTEEIIYVRDGLAAFAVFVLIIAICAI